MAELIKEVDMSNFSQQIFNINYSPCVTATNSTFIDFLKQSYNDLCICWDDTQDYQQGGERTLFSEVFLQQFKFFAKMTKLLHFKWIEKKMNDTDHIWLAKKNYVKKNVQLKLLDESSGVGDDIYAHTLEDTIKYLKHGSDSLASILCDHQYCDVHTTQDIVVLTCHIIKNKLHHHEILSRKIIKVGCGSSSIPLMYESRKDKIKLYKAFVFIYLTLDEQIKLYERLADERLGFTVVEEKDMVRNCDHYFNAEN